MAWRLVYINDRSLVIVTVIVLQCFFYMVIGNLLLWYLYGYKAKSNAQQFYFAYINKQRL